MSSEERQKQFKDKIVNLPETDASARIAENFGFSNSARVLEGGLFACTNNLQPYTKRILKDPKEGVSQFVFLCVLTFPPQDEVYFAISVANQAHKINSGLITLAREVEQRNKALTAEGKKPGSVNNNVKFYISKGGDLFFHNTDFMETINQDALDENFLAKIDSISFSIYPPTVSARRSLLAREFVGYLGNLIGAERVHEVSVWPDKSAVGPNMLRMPHEIPISEIEQAVSDQGGYYPGGEVRRFHSALNFLKNKHFVILSGLSGTGKTRLALTYARAIHGITDPDASDPLLFVCAVRPEWTDPTGLTGYYDVLSNRYVVPKFLEAVLVATAHRNSPVFVVLDEMNLARVEYYFSDVLSSIETGHPLQLHSNGVPLEGTTGTSIRAELPLPTNLFITGTVNIDETTNPVSDKVLDRASVIDMSNVDLSGFLADLEKRDASLKNARTACETMLKKVHELMSANGLGFGYRVAEEFVRYHAFATTHLQETSDAIIDELMVQKVLVKLRGTEKQRALLSGITSLLDEHPHAQSFLRNLTEDLDEFGSFQANR